LVNSGTEYLRTKRVGGGENYGAENDEEKVKQRKDFGIVTNDEKPRKMGGTW